MQKYLKIAFFAFASAILVACSNSVDPSDSGSGDIGKISEPAEETSSSSIMEESSSSGIPSSLTDPRDGQTYKVVTIGSQIWMAENLNYETEGSFCYMDIDSNCTKYGRLYKWYAAMDSAGTFSASGKGCGYETKCSPTGTIRGICPEGWHLPDSTEWHTLIKAAKTAGGKDAAGKVLLSTTGWNDDRNGTDSFDFSAYPAGVRGINGNYKLEGRIAEFWTSTEYNMNKAIDIGINDSHASHYHDEKYEGRSIRCVYDIAAPESSSSATSSSSEVPFTDPRDGQTYRTVTIGSQIWMAENLNYKIDGSRCYGDSIENCSKYGRYYTWVAAQEACPSGWHLPNEREWDALLDFAGIDLRSATGWYKDNYEYGYNYNGNDDYGFTALPSRPNGYQAEFWSSTEFPGRCIDNDSSHALYATIYQPYHEGSMATGIMCGSQDQFFPIRCISNESQTPPDSSTASPAVPPCKTDSTDNCEYGTLKDDRDGQTYKTVKIGNQEWMAENLEYKTDSSFYSHKGLTKYGRYYTWEAALKACPEGWHLPDSTEWATLRESVGENAGKALKSTTDWEENSALTNSFYYCGTAYLDLVGTDSYGFAVLPAGTYIDDEFDVVRSKTEAWFWTKTEAYHRRSPEPPTSFANVASFQNGMGVGGLQSKSEKFSVRCIKD